MYAWRTREALYEKNDATWWCFRCPGDHSKEEADTEEVLGICSYVTEGYMNEEKQRTPKQQKQYEAYRRWYTSPKGAAYRQRQKEKHALGVDVVEIKGGEVTVK
jgi:hypothetical protein